MKYLKVLFFGPPRTGKTSMKRRLVGQIQNLAKEPVQEASTGVAEAYDVIVKLGDKTTSSTTVITSKWSTVKAYLGKEKSTHETHLDEELQVLYQIINGVVLTIEKNSHAIDEKEAQDEGQSPTRMLVDTISSTSSSLVKSCKVAESKAKTFQEIVSDEKPKYGLGRKEMEEIEKAFVAFRKVLHTPGQQELKILLDDIVLMNMVDHMQYRCLCVRSS